MNVSAGLTHKGHVFKSWRQLAEEDAHGGSRFAWLHSRVPRQIGERSQR